VLLQGINEECIGAIYFELPVGRSGLNCEGLDRIHASLWVLEIF